MVQPEITLREVFIARRRIAGIAALRERRVEKLGKNVAVVVSGSNVDLSLLLRIVRDHGGA